MGRLCQQALLHHTDADIPGRLAIDWFGDDGIQQSAAAYLLDEWRVDLLDFLTENLSHLLCVLHQFLALHHLQCLYGHTGGQGESTEC